MALSTQAKLDLLFKRLNGKASTDETRDLHNELYESGFSVASQQVFARTLPSAPTATAYAITQTGFEQVVEYVRLPVIAEPYSGGKAFLVQLPSDYQTQSTSRIAGRDLWTNSRTLAQTKGAIQLVTPQHGKPYEVKIFTGGTSTIGSGTRVFVGDARNWTLDYFAGVFTQESTSAVLNWVEGFLYVGPMVQKHLEGTYDIQSDEASTVAAGKIVYIKTNGRFALAGASTAGISGTTIGITFSAIAASAFGPVVVREGTIIGGFTGLVLDKPVFISTVAGNFTQDVSAFPTGAAIYRVGYALSNSEIKFNPQFIIVA